MINILHVNSNYLTSELHENLINYLSNEETANTIFMPIKEEKKKEFEYASKYDVYHPVAFSDFHKYFFLWKQSKIYQQLKQDINIEKNDIIHAHTLFTDGNVAYRLKKEYDIPYVVTIRGYTDIDNFFKKRINLRSRGRKILKEASRIIFLSEISRKDLLDKYIDSESMKKEILDKSKVIPNGIDDFWFENEGSSKSIEDNKELRVISVGKVYKRKNFLATIDALEILQSENWRVELSIVGKVWDKKYAQKIKNQDKIKVTMIDQIPKEKLIELYREHDLFVMPSHQETFGLVYAEAMSQGLPVIYSSNQGFDKQFEDGIVGYPVDPNSPEDIAEKIKLAIGDYETISNNAIENYKKFNWEKLSKSLLKIYQEAVNF